jgi:excisionase family DNA binding protein
MIRTLDSVVVAHGERLPPGAFNGIRQNLTKQYEVTLAQELENQQTIPAILETMEEARFQIENLPIVNEDFSAFLRGIRRVYTRGRRAMRLAYTQPSAEVFHEWRKRVKYLWHQIEILESAWPRIFSMLGDELHQLSDYLGDDHDLAVLRSTILDAPAGFEDERELLKLVQLIDQDRLRLEASARPLGERLYYDTPKNFTRRLETYWRAWKSEDDQRQSELIQYIQDHSPATIQLDRDLLTTTEMAAQLEISPGRVRRLIQGQKLPAEKVGAVWIIKADMDTESETFEGTLLSPREAADHLDISLGRIWKMIRSGQLPATKVGRYWVIREADLGLPST